METAIDSAVGDVIDVAEYRQRHGRATAGFRDPPAPVCPLCGQGVFARGDDALTTAGHFAHHPRAGPCPSKARAAAAYLDLKPVDPDPEYAAWLRRAFLREWWPFLGFLQASVPFLSPLELDLMLTMAARRRLWDRRHIEPWHVPLCLLVSTEFMPASSLRTRAGEPTRRLWFRFWFDAPMRQVEELWIRREGQVRLHRGSYTLPADRARLPGRAELAGDRAVVAGPALFEGCTPSGEDALVHELRAIMAKHLE